MSASFDTKPLIPASIVGGAWSSGLDLAPPSSIGRLPVSGCRHKVDVEVFELVVLVVLVLEQVDKAEDHRLVLALRGVLDLVLDQVE